MRLVDNTICLNVDKEKNQAIDVAKRLFYEGKIFIYPTDTIYGFGANPFNPDAVKKITEIKQREEEKKFIMLAGSIEMLMRYIELRDERIIDFLMAIWPSPVSVILPLQSKSAEQLGLNNAAFRIPKDNFVQNLVTSINMPLISTSVNRKGKPALQEYSLVEQEFKYEVDAILYSTKSTFYKPSTLITLTGDEPALLREGQVSFDDIQKIFKQRTGRK